MKAKLTIDGKEFEVEMDDNRVKKDEYYYTGLVDGTSDFFRVNHDAFDSKFYECAEYYSDKTVAENNARADKLYRQLRRFAVEHRKNKIDWNNGRTDKFFFFYDHNIDKFNVSMTCLCQEYGNIYFDSEETTQLAIVTFKDELIWYFTEYKDSLGGALKC